MAVSLSARVHNYYKQFQNSLRKKQIERFSAGNELSGRFNDTSRHIIISGEPRGGTTWLAEALSEKESLIIWEPLHSAALGDYKNKSLQTKSGMFLTFLREHCGRRHLAISTNYLQEPQLTMKAFMVIPVHIMIFPILTALFLNSAGLICCCPGW